MEEILLNIDSRYRDILIYPNECKFKYNLEKIYKNIISARMISLEINNSATYIDDIKQNNFITVHLPNKINDPDGTTIQLDNGLYQTVSIIQNTFNGLFNELFNNNSSLKRLTIDNKPYAEKYFYFFYLNYDIEVIFNFNEETTPSSLSTKLILKHGWYSVYGLVLQIQNYITNKYNERKVYKNANPTDSTILDLDSGKFTLYSFSLPVFDRRFRHENSEYDCVRYDPISEYNGNEGTLIANLKSLKYSIYKTYINDTTKFILQTTDTGSNGILDKLNSGTYQMPKAPDETQYTINENMVLTSNSIYHLNIAYGIQKPAPPTNQSTQIYNLLMHVDLTALKVSFSNFFTKTSSSFSSSENYSFYYYYTPVPNILSDSTDQTWNKVEGDETINLFDKLFNDKDFAYEQGFITKSQKDDIYFIYTAEKDIPEFEINFSTYPIINPVSNGLVDIKKMVYPPVGYYLGFRPNITKQDNQFIFNSIIDNTERIIYASKNFDTAGNNYMFLKINNWGYLDFFGNKMFAKILLTVGLGNPDINDYINKEFRFRQPVDINKLEIELVDYLGNTIDLNGADWSFTIEFNQIINSNNKKTAEKEAIVFKTLY